METVSFVLRLGTMFLFLLYLLTLSPTRYRGKNKLILLFINLFNKLQIQNKEYFSLNMQELRQLWKNSGTNWPWRYSRYHLSICLMRLMYLENKGEFYLLFISTFLLSMIHIIHIQVDYGRFLLKHLFAPKYGANFLLWSSCTSFSTSKLSNL